MQEARSLQQGSKGTDPKNTPLFGELPSHNVRLLVVGNPSDRVRLTLHPHERLTAA